MEGALAMSDLRDEPKPRVAETKDRDGYTRYQAQCTCEKWQGELRWYREEAERDEAEHRKEHEAEEDE